MNIPSSQIQLKISLSEQLNELLQSKASRLGVPLTQYVKHLLMKEVEDEKYPTFQASEQVEKNTQEALKQIDRAVDASVFFQTLNEG